MFEPQNLLDLQDNRSATAAGGVSDPNSWLSGDGSLHDIAAPSSPTALDRTLSSLSNASVAGNPDPVIYTNLVEMVPLIQSLIQLDQKANPSFTRRGSMIYTKTPSRESLARKASEVKKGNGAQSIPRKRNKDQGSDRDGIADNSSLLSRLSSMEKDMEELTSLRDQVVDLQRKLSEKDELLKLAETSRTEIQAKLNDLKSEAAEKDSLLNSTKVQLADTKINLADKQAAVEKLQWEAMTSKQSVEQLQKDLKGIQGEISSFMVAFQELARNNSTLPAEDYDAVYCASDHNPDTDDLDEIEMRKLEAAKEAYATAVAAAKVKQDDESIAAAANARMHLQSFFMKPKTSNGGKGSVHAGIPRIITETVSH